ncbi:hypothetical protein ACRAWF_25540 [Streptomyces sp. L7]
MSQPAQVLLGVLGDSLLPVLDAVEPAVEEFAAALGDLVEGGLPAAARGGGRGGRHTARPHPAAPRGGRRPGRLLPRTPAHRGGVDGSAGSAAAPAGGPRATGGHCGHKVLRAALPPLADLTEAAAATTKTAVPMVVAGEELVVSALERVQPVCCWLRPSARGGWPGPPRYG